MTRIIPKRSSRVSTVITGSGYFTGSDAFVGAVYRYYESRRRRLNDARPQRVPVVEEQKKRAKIRAFQKQACALC